MLAKFQLDGVASPGVAVAGSLGDSSFGAFYFADVDRGIRSRVDAEQVATGPNGSVLIVGESSALNIQNWPPTGCLTSGAIFTRAFPGVVLVGTLNAACPLPR